MFWRKKKKTNVEPVHAAAADDVEPKVVAVTAPIVGTVLEPTPATPDVKPEIVVETQEDQAVSGRIDLKTRRVTIDGDGT
ncbi:MAG: hypothetical protein GY791_21250 [Alphaproteobacteria bacterium]|nr:hypothetical protein [Alphaproteobacteria bacterium]